MTEQLLNVLKICLLVLLYLFFLRVLHAVWTEVNGPRRRRAERSRTTQRVQDKALAGRPAGHGSGSRAQRNQPVLRIVEPASEAGKTFPLGDELTVGRAAGCQVTLDDTYVSQLHARIFRRDGELFVEDLGSTNGTYLNRNKVGGPMPLKPGDHLQVGSVVMELT